MPHALLHRFRQLSCKLRGGNPDQRARAQASKRHNVLDPTVAIEDLAAPAWPITPVQCNPVVINAIDLYIRYQTVNVKVLAAELIALSKANVAKGQPDLIIVSFKIGTNLDTIDAVHPGWLAQTVAIGRQLAKMCPFLRLTWYWWPYPGDQAGMERQAKKFIDTVFGFSGGELYATEALQCDSEQTGLTRAMVGWFVSYVESRTQRRCLFEYGLVTNQRPDRRWRARYNTAKDWHDFYVSFLRCMAGFGYIPTIFQWGGGLNGYFFKGINGGLTRVDSNLFGNIADIGTAFGPVVNTDVPFQGYGNEDVMPTPRIVKAQEHASNGAAPQFFYDGMQKTWIRHGLLPQFAAPGKQLEYLALAELDAITTLGPVPSGFHDNQGNLVP